MLLQDVFNIGYVINSEKIKLIANEENITCCVSVEILEWTKNLRYFYLREFRFFFILKLSFFHLKQLLHEAVYIRYQSAKCSNLLRT